MSDSIQKFFNAPHFAAGYENKTHLTNWLGPDLLFGLAFRYVHAGEKLLDLGIGTGLCGELFARAGLKVYGLDASREMLKIAAAKNFAAELQEHDLDHLPWPYADNAMDHAVCCGVLHIFADPTPIFRETARVLRPGGVFAFSCLEHDDDSPSSVIDHHGCQAYRHGFQNVKQLLTASGWQIMKTIQFITQAQAQKRYFRAYAVTKTS
ncbi:MAG: class I SAM-dependent methyltransferase [Victivallales bacterium]|nr:class I SAM-dependent methyltransferase [Victivallales bacterium]